MQESGASSQAGTLMYVPVYRGDLPADSLARRRAALLGWAYSPYRMNDLMTGVLQDWQAESGRYLHLRIFDGEAADPAALLYDSGDASGSGLGDDGGDLATSRRLEVQGRTWRLDFDRSAGAPAIDFRPAWLAAAAGVALSGLLYGLLMSLARTRERGVRLAHSLTEAIRRREKQLEESEFRWRFALEGSGDGLWDWNLADGVVWFSPQLESMLGFAPGELGNRVEAWSDRIHPEDRERTLATLEEHLRDRVPAYACEHRLRCKDGHYLWVLDRGLVVDRDEAGKPRRMIGTHADITRGKDLEASLRHSRAELEEAQRIARFASWTLDRDSGRVTWTPELFRMLGVPPTADGVAPPFDTHARFFTPEAAMALERAVDRLLTEGTPYELELELVRADGSRGWMQARGEPVRDAEGRVSGIHGVAADITDRKLAGLRVEQLGRLYAALSECNWAIVHCADTDELLDRVCEVMVRHGGIDAAWIGRIDPDSGRVTPACGRGEGAAAISEVPVSADPGEPTGRGPLGVAARELRPVWVDDLAQCPEARHWLPVAERHGWRSAAFLPLLHRRVPFAVLALFSTRAGWGDQDTRPLVEQIASNVSFAVEKLGVGNNPPARGG